jgi:hypothetical protein
LVLTIVLLALTYRREFFGGDEELTVTATRVHMHRRLATKSILVVIAMMAAFFAGQPPAKVGLIAGGVLLLTRVVRSERVYREIDWPLLLIFAGLFVVVAGVENALLTPDLVSRIAGLGLDRLPVLGIATAILSNLVSNVPAVLVFEALSRSPGRPAAQLGGRGDGLNLRRQSDRARFSCQFDCRETGRIPRRDYRVLGVFVHRGTADTDDARPRAVVALVWQHGHFAFPT